MYAMDGEHQWWNLKDRCVVHTTCSYMSLSLTTQWMVQLFKPGVTQKIPTPPPSLTPPPPPLPPLPATTVNVSDACLLRGEKVQARGITPVRVSFLLLPTITSCTCSSVLEEHGPQVGSITHILIHRQGLGMLWCENTNFAGETKEGIEWPWHMMAMVWGWYRDRRLLRRWCYGCTKKSLGRYR